MRAARIVAGMNARQNVKAGRLKVRRSRSKPPTVTRRPSRRAVAAPSALEAVGAWEQRTSEHSEAACRVAEWHRCQHIRITQCARWGKDGKPATVVPYVEHEAVLGHRLPRESSALVMAMEACMPYKRAPPHLSARERKLHFERQSATPMMTVGCNDGSLRVWLPNRDWRFHSIVALPEVPAVLRWSAALNVLLVACSGALAGTVLGVDLHDSKILLRYAAHRDVVSDMVDVSHGCVATAGMDRMVQVWQSRAGAARESTAAVLGGDADGDHRLQLRQVAVFRGHRTGVRQLVYSQQYKLLVSVACDNTALVWDVTTRTRVSSIVHRDPVVAAAVLPLANDLIVTMDAAAMVRLSSLSIGQGQKTAPVLQQFALPGAGATKYSHIVTHNVQVVAFGRRRAAFQPAPADRHHDVPAQAVYSVQSCTFLVAQGNEVLVFDAHTGVLTARHRVARSDCIASALVLDRPGRKFIVGDTAGTVSAFNTVSGLSMRSTALPECPGRRSAPVEVAAAVYCVEDACVVVAAGTDMHILDDSSNDDMEVMRSVFDAHSAPITCAAFNYAMSMVATGASDGTLRVWDFQVCSCVADLKGHGAEVTAVAFPSPAAVPLLVSADTTGAVMLWACRPFSSLAVPIASFTLPPPSWTFTASPDEAVRSERRRLFKRTVDIVPAVTALHVMCSTGAASVAAAAAAAAVAAAAGASGPGAGAGASPADGKVALHIVTGDALGRALTWDCSECATRMGLTVLPQACMPARQATYHPRKSVSFNHQHKRSQTSAPSDDRTGAGTSAALVTYVAMSEALYGAPKFPSNPWFEDVATAHVYRMHDTPARDDQGRRVLGNRHVDVRFLMPAPEFVESRRMVGLAPKSCIAVAAGSTVRGVHPTPCDGGTALLTVTEAGCTLWAAGSGTCLGEFALPEGEEPAGAAADASATAAAVAVTPPWRFRPDVGQLMWDKEQSAKRLLKDVQAGVGFDLDAILASLHDSDDDEADRAGGGDGAGGAGGDSGAELVSDKEQRDVLRSVTSADAGEDGDEKKSEDDDGGEPSPSPMTADQRQKEVVVEFVAANPRRMSVLAASNLNPALLHVQEEMQRQADAVRPASAGTARGTRSASGRMAVPSIRPGAGAGAGSAPPTSMIGQAKALQRAWAEAREDAAKKAPAASAPAAPALTIAAAAATARPRSATFGTYSNLKHEQRRHDFAAKMEARIMQQVDTTPSSFLQKRLGLQPHRRRPASAAAGGGSAAGRLLRGVAGTARSRSWGAAMDVATAVHPSRPGRPPAAGVSPTKAVAPEDSLDGVSHASSVGSTGVWQPPPLSDFARGRMPAVDVHALSPSFVRHAANRTALLATVAASNRARGSPTAQHEPPMAVAAKAARPQSAYGLRASLTAATGSRKSRPASALTRTRRYSSNA